MASMLCETIPGAAHDPVAKPPGILVRKEGKEETSREGAKTQAGVSVEAAW